ncbi:uncharacterized protein Pyn_05042 [Prunus yedoensis var. nudiflora]|uniref:Uncharacterized protein n=1 Tax=Prunus yedoensis var. nudiflora TaxID=2094558 RepID=A0A314Z108_PRUYE|nr:uncharacterized protein Pyn_05042 [Prunus yedoensis var. nudiflora]
MAGMLGFTKDDGHEVKDNGMRTKTITRPRTEPISKKLGFPVKASAFRFKSPLTGIFPGPVLVPCRSGDGGVQGLRWHAKRLRIDEDGDVADEFLDEVFPQMSVSTENNMALARFEVKYSTKPAKVRTQFLSPDGKIQQRVEYRGRSQWI